MAQFISERGLHSGFIAVKLVQDKKRGGKQSESNSLHSKPWFTLVCVREIRGGRQQAGEGAPSLRRVLPGSSKGRLLLSLWQIAQKEGKGNGDF